MPFNKLNHAHLGEIRPRFKLHITLEAKEALDYIKTSIDEDKTVHGNIVMGHARLSIPADDRHYWSPELDVGIEKSEEGEGSMVRCLVGPKQSVWVMLMFFYSTVGIYTLFALMIGLSNWSLDKPATILWTVPLGLAIMPTIYFAAQSGQRKGRDQMLHLISFVYHVLDKHGQVERIE